MVLLAWTARVFLEAMTPDPGATLGPGSLRPQDPDLSLSVPRISGKLLCVFRWEGVR